MSTAIGTHEAKTRLSEYLNRVAYRRERIVVERHGKPIAALVSIEDLRRLEAIDAPAPTNDDDEASHRLIFRRLAEEAGILGQWPSGEREPLDEFAALDLEGPPLSEQIIAERR